MNRKDGKGDYVWYVFCSDAPSMFTSRIGNFQRFFLLILAFKCCWLSVHLYLSRSNTFNIYFLIFFYQCVFGTAFLCHMLCTNLRYAPILQILEKDSSIACAYIQIRSIHIFVSSCLSFIRYVL